MKARIILSVSVLGLLSWAPAKSASVLPPNVADTITAADLKGDLSFLASDELEGRYTPSPGLQIAAQFIASRFRAAGLEPGGDHGYFQTAEMVDRKMPAPASDMTLREGAGSTTISAKSLVILNSSGAVRIEDAPVLVVRARDPEALKGVDVSGRAVVVPARPSGKLSQEAMMAFFRKAEAFDSAMTASKAAMLILVQSRLSGGGNAMLWPANEADKHRLARVGAVSDELQKWVDHPESLAARTVSFDVPAPEDQRVKLDNVIGVLPGSDPKLKASYVMLTAHYDHIGTRETGKRLSTNRTPDGNDTVYNGANDDGSGTVSVIEIAKGLAKLKRRPKRSIVFMTFFGEERGDIGSGYYGEHPAFPIARTVADVNLEQVGRTDSTVGPQVNTASLTGYDYSDVTTYLEEAGRRTGIRVYLDKEASDAYFERSDNAALAEKGVPAHTLTVAFDYPDYHGLGDEWQKIDYENMARVDRMVALALVGIANSVKAPEWNAANAKTAEFRTVREKEMAHEAVGVR